MFKRRVQMQVCAGVGWDFEVGSRRRGAGAAKWQQQVTCVTVVVTINTATHRGFTSVTQSPPLFSIK